MFIVLKKTVIEILESFIKYMKMLKLKNLLLNFFELYHVWWKTYFLPDSWMLYFNYDLKIKNIILSENFVVEP